MQEIPQEESVTKILSSRQNLPEDFRVFFIDDSSYVYINNSHIQYSTKTDKIIKTQTELPIFKAFKKIEFVIIEMLRIYSVKIFTQEDKMITKIIESLNVTKRIMLLHEFHIINDELRNKLLALFNTRNHMEYTFTEMHVKYDQKNVFGYKEPSKSNLTKLCNDINMCWETLTEIYQSMQYSRDVKNQVLEIIKKDFRQIGKTS